MQPIHTPSRALTSNVTKISSNSHSNHIAAVDGLRGLAIALVMVRHFVEPFLSRGETVSLSSIALTDRIFYRACTLGSVGVDLFFVISGFLITGILLDTKGNGDFFRRFYWRRTIRIFPLYYATLVVCFLVYPVLWGTSRNYVIGDSTTYQLWYWMYAENVLFGIERRFVGLAHFWSLAVEEQFYLVWPMVVFLTNRKYLAVACVLCILCAVLVRFAVMSKNLPVEVAYVNTFARIDALAVGALLAIAARSPKSLRGLRTPAFALGTAAALLLVALVLTAPETAGVGGRTHLINIMGGSILSIGFGALLVVAITDKPHNITSRICSSLLLRCLGKYSYCLYVVHPFVWGALAFKWRDDWIPAIGNSLIPGRLVFFALAGGISMILAMASWKYFEAPLLRLKDCQPWQPRIGPGARA